MDNPEAALMRVLYDEHGPALWRYAVRLTGDPARAEDVVQESFFKAYQKLALFEGRASFKSWLFQIAINTAKNRFRKVNLEVVNLDDVDFGVQSGAEVQMIRVDLEEQMHEEIEKLPHRQKTALVLRIFEDLSFKEIAQIMECPYDTAKANYRHALMALKTRMETNTQWHSWSDWTQEQPVGEWQEPQHAEAEG